MFWFFVGFVFKASRVMVASRNYADFANEATFEIKVKKLNT